MDIGYTKGEESKRERDREKLQFCDVIYEDREPSRCRVGLNAMLKECEIGDCIYIWELSSLAESMEGMNRKSQAILATGAKIIFICEGIDTSTQKGKHFIEALNILDGYERKCWAKRGRVRL